MVGTLSVDWGPFPFHFYNWWIKDTDLMKEAVKEWNDIKCGGSKGAMLASKTKVVKVYIKKWLSSKKSDSILSEDIEKRLAEVDKKAETEGLNLKRLTEDERLTLEVDFDIEEMRSALCSCNKSKAPGSDRSNQEFVKANWEVIRDDFMDFLNEFNKDKAIVKDLNRSFIALIPKVGNSKTMTDFHPISLIGSMYKVLAKSAGKLA
ncbi:hypothetical protein Ddye_006861 [Dipteronia dyeriana]|uniref:RNA-directed DNA polymerase, eukaryota, reverse transcriptase zinc-binding domain protein n=1 Tax=Dipteronia dyeriana TaxID=168575 RepID=A0AAE0CRK4_9ROSI|nr:hypothetical protein Ddye_006861 [Dipteronia dyeriana]